MRRRIPPEGPPEAARKPEDEKKLRVKPTANEPEYFKPGDCIGNKYEVQRVLGKGGFGVVYLVNKTEWHGLCALKTFRDEFLADGNAREAFKKEALLWVNLEEHPFILAAQWVQEVSGRLFVQMDYVPPDPEGRVSLHDHLRSGQLLPTERAVEWAIQFCLGMEHANTHGIQCHRDIKPANILISQDVLKITDFGLAAAAEVVWRDFGEQGDSLVTGSSKDGFGFSLVRTKSGMCCGTPGYMPPEVYRGKPADVRSDIYSFGLVLCQMATGSPVPPFVGVYRGDIKAYMRGAYEQQMTGRVPPVAGPLDAVIARCLNPDPSRRYANFAEVRDALEPIFQRLIGRTFAIPATVEQTVGFWNNKGSSLCTLGRHEEAIDCFDKALAIDPRKAKPWANKGVSLGALGRSEEAIACYDKALAIDPRYAPAWSNKGSDLAALERHEEAIACYDKALAIDPQFATIWSNKGVSLTEFGQNEEAIACYDKALAIDPRYALAWICKGNALAALERHEEAIDSYDKALAIDPRDATAWYNKGGSLGDLGQHEEAIACYDKGLAIDPRYAYAWYNKGGSLGALRRREEAIACYDKALAIDPQDADVWYNKALLEDTIGRASSAVRSYRKVIALTVSQDAAEVAYAQKRIQELEKK